jgi:two-component system response regulator RegA
MTSSIIILDHDGGSRQQLARAFEERGFAALATDTVETALTAGRAHPVHLVVTEAILHGRHTLPFIRQVKSEHPQTPVCVCTTFGSIRLVVKAMRAGASSFLVKPVTADQLLMECEVVDGVEPLEHPSYHRAVWEYVNQCRELAGSLAEASRWLGLHPRSLRRMLQKSPPIR